MSKMVTRCPQCNTAFKVTEDHLKIANGAVRCGSCLHVFQARQHWVNPDAAAAPVTTDKSALALQAALAAKSETPAAPAPAKATGKFVFDQSAIDGGSASSLLDEPDPRIPATALTSAHQKSLDDLDDDDLISDDLMVDGAESADLQPAAQSTSEFGDADDDYSSLFDELDDGHAEGDDFEALFNGEFNDLDGVNAEDDSGVGTSDESWAKELLTELEKEDEPEPVDLSQVEDGRKMLMDFSNPTDVDAARRDLGMDQPAPMFGEKARFGEKTGRAAMIAHIEPAPVELVVERDTAAWKSGLIWGGAAVALFLLALGQYVFFNFDKLARAEGSRAYMQSLCGVLSCQLPASENWRSIKISNLVVRKHPQVQDGLAVDAILFNTSDQSLPFPTLELYFNSMEQLPVASRRFGPEEYLAGEMTGQTAMPAGRPVHIAFEIVNPGDEAVNWSLQVSKFATDQSVAE